MQGHYIYYLNAQFFLQCFQVYSHHIQSVTAIKVDHPNPKLYMLASFIAHKYIPHEILTHI